MAKEVVSYACVQYLDDKVKYYYSPIQTIFYKKNDKGPIVPKDFSDFDKTHKYQVLWVNGQNEVVPTPIRKDDVIEFFAAYIICLAETEDEARTKGTNKSKRLMVPKKLTSSESNESLSENKELKPKTGKIIKKIVQQVNSQRTIEKYKQLTLINNRKSLSLGSSTNEYATENNVNDVENESVVHNNAKEIKTMDLREVKVVLKDIFKTHGDFSESQKVNVHQHYESLVRDDNALGSISKLSPILAGSQLSQPETPRSRHRVPFRLETPLSSTLFRQRDQHLPSGRLRESRFGSLSGSQTTPRLCFPITSDKSVSQHALSNASRNLDFEVPTDLAAVDSQKGPPSLNSQPLLDDLEKSSLRMPSRSRVAHLPSIDSDSSLETKDVSGSKSRSRTPLSSPNSTPSRSQAGSPEGSLSKSQSSSLAASQKESRSKSPSRSVAGSPKDSRSKSPPRSRNEPRYSPFIHAQDPPYVTTPPGAPLISVGEVELNPNLP